MSRVQGWVDKYVAFIVSRSETAFEFGKHDCCITACDMIHAIIGVDPAVSFRDVYRTPMGALKKIKEYGDIDLIAEEVCHNHGWPEIPPNFATRCDLVCIDTGGDRKALGWLDLNASQIYVASSVGFGVCPRNRALRAWRIG